MLNRIFEFIILGLWICIAIVLYIQNDIIQNGGMLISESLKINQEEFEIKRIKFLEGDLLEVDIQQDTLKTIICKLDCEIDSYKKLQLKKLLRESSLPPKLVLVEKQGDVWFVKIYLISKAKRISLNNWLDRVVEQ